MHIKGSLSKQGAELFYGCPIEELTLDEGVKTVGSYASFRAGKFETLTVPASVDTLGEHSFNDTLRTVCFLGDAPEHLGREPFRPGTTLYYKKGTDGWETTPLKDDYTLIETETGEADAH